MSLVSPSLLSADFANLAQDINKINNADMLHIDVMDGHFVPNISIGIPVVQSIKKATDIFLDVHLMISNPLRYVEDFAKAGADLICFHTESDDDAQGVINKIRQCGTKVGIALKPATKASDVARLIPLVDMVLVMTVEPGFGGQSFMADMLDKIKEVRAIANENGSKLDIQVDGGINLETARLCVDAGANILVAGSFVFGSDNPKETIKALQEIN